VKARRWRIEGTTAYELIDQEAVALNLKTGLYYRLSPVAARALDCLQRDLDLEDLLDVIVNEFEVDRSVARADLVQLVTELESFGLVAPRP